MAERTPLPLFAPFNATVIDAGGGVVELLVDRDTYEYPMGGVHVAVLPVKEYHRLRGVAARPAVYESLTLLAVRWLRRWLKRTVSSGRTDA